LNAVTLTYCFMQKLAPFSNSGASETEPFCVWSTVPRLWKITRHVSSWVRRSFSVRSTTLWNFSEILLLRSEIEGFVSLVSRRSEIVDFTYEMKKKWKSETEHHEKLRRIGICTCLFVYVLKCLKFVVQLLPDRRGGRPESSLSPSTWRRDPLPTPGLEEGDVITPSIGV
jgi:hypothetical protein